MITLKVNYKHQDQVNNGIITGLNTITSEIKGTTLEYWNRYKDERAKQVLAEKSLEFNYGYSKSKEMIIVNVEIINK
jgi:hypothetical protein